MTTLPAPLAPLAAYRQWIIYRLQPHPTKPGKMDKIPCSYRTGGDVSLMNPVNWTDYETAAAAHVKADIGHGSGVGFVFTPDDPFWFLDVDGALQGDTWSPLATELYHTLPDAAWEVSQSGRGLHAIGSGPLPPHGTRNQLLGLELYHKDRFVALTLRCVDGGSAGTVCPAAADIAAAYFPPVDHAQPDDWTSEPVSDWLGPEDDATLLRMALASRSAASALGTPGGHVTASFVDLWEANVDVLSKAYPGDPYGASEADAALASHLAFWTGKNCERIERLMRQSALVRDKWDRASAYLEPTILRACAVTSRVLQQAPAEPVPPEAAAAVSTGAVTGRYVPPAAYPDWFPGCAFVIAAGAIYTPRHGLLTATSFDTIYGGKRFILDGEGEKTSTSAWEAFRLCQQWRPPVADDLCFRPELPSGAMVDYEGRTLLNSYVPIETARMAGDPTPFFDFLAKLLPVQRDRDILLSYMAGVIQNPGLKAQWWPVLQGAEGNGKTMLLSIMSHAIGHRYTHLVNPDAMAKTGGQFNKWVQGNLFCGLEEIYVAKRRDFLESFKTTVTNDRIAIEGKGADQGTGDNRCNGIMLTNHREGVPISVDTRRYAIFYTAQQCEADLVRDEMMGGYFPKLYDWLRAEGYAIVNNWLREWTPIAEFNPAGTEAARARAPKTSSHADALRESLGSAEQEVQEAIDQGQVGFRGGWVSSHYLVQLLDRLRINIPPSKRRAFMRSLGYDYHPAMPDGRANNPVTPDGVKSRLYVRTDHLVALNVESHVAICDAYTAAQQMLAGERAA